jgi:hypothetical protein
MLNQDPHRLLEHPNKSVSDPNYTKRWLSGTPILGRSDKKASVHELSALNIPRMMEYANDENPRWLG